MQKNPHIQNIKDIIYICIFSKNTLQDAVLVCLPHNQKKGGIDLFDIKPLSLNERRKLNPYYLEVINHYEKVTNQTFSTEDLITLKLLIEFAPPAAINSMISNFYKKYPNNFLTLSYIYNPTKNFFKNKKRSKH